MVSDTKNVKLGVCRVIFDGTDLGYTKGGVEVEVQTETHKVEVDQFGKAPINEIIMSRTVSAKVPLAETTLKNMVKIMPGASLVAQGGVRATGTITVTTQPTANDTLTVNGVVFTYRSGSAPLATDILIGGTTAATAQNTQAKLEAFTDPRVADAAYTVATNIVTVTYEDFGVAGNVFTLARTGTGITVSGATLTGGVDPTKQKVVVPSSVGTDLLQLARKLVLHPKGLPDADKSEDFVIPRAMTPGALTFAYKLDEERVFNATFTGYPDPVTETLFVVGDETATV